MFTTNDESNFFLKHIEKNHKVLEYGSGQSTSEIATRCEKLISIEHQKSWYNQVINSVPSNVTLILAEPDEIYLENTYNCGSYNQFKSYINSPIEYGKFDIILIDGRARVECAKFCRYISKDNTLIFIHDFTSRLENHNYKEALRYLELIDSVGDMSKFKLKNI
jgi:hypothetical protein